MYRPPKDEEPTLSTYYRSEVLYKKSQPIIGNSELEAIIWVEACRGGLGNLSEITDLHSSKDRTQEIEIATFELRHGLELVAEFCTPFRVLFSETLPRIG